MDIFWKSNGKVLKIKKSFEKSNGQIDFTHSCVAQEAEICQMTLSLGDLDNWSMRR